MDAGRGWVVAAGLELTRRRFMSAVGRAALGGIALSARGHLVRDWFAEGAQSGGAVGIQNIELVANEVRWELAPGAHVALVGVRGLIGGPVGMLLYRLSGTPHATFGCSVGLLLLGAYLMFRLGRSTSRSVDATAPPGMAGG